MPRSARNKAATGIYHVLMRGINRQVIFEEPEDYQYFMAVLERVGFQTDDEGLRVGQNCTYYAYCLMSNHFHLLIREREEKISLTLKRIASAYVYYYNRKYQRSGHLFKERFRSEPVENLDYFTTLLRYIHQDPVRVGLAARAEDYPYSSWGEYCGKVFPLARLCHVEAVLQRMPFDELQKMVCAPLPEKTDILDIDREESRHQLSDEQVKQLLVQYYGAMNTSQFQQLERSRQVEAIRALREQGASIRQLERLTGLSRGVIYRV